MLNLNYPKAGALSYSNRGAYYLKIMVVVMTVVFSNIMLKYITKIIIVYHRFCVPWTSNDSRCHNIPTGVNHFRGAWYFPYVLKPRNPEDDEAKIEENQYYFWRYPYVISISSTIYLHTTYQCEYVLTIPTDRKGI